MKHKRFANYFIVVVVSLVMVIGIAPTVSAADNTLPGSAYWTDVSGLSGYSMSNSGATIGKIKFGLDGNNSRIWAIAGVDNGNSNALALLSTTPIHIMYSMVNDTDLNEYDSTAGGYSTMDFVTNMNKYLSTSYFSAGEKGVMNPVTVKSWSWDSGNYLESSTSGKQMYLPNSYDYKISEYQGSHGYTSLKEMYLGVNNGIAIYLPNITTANGFIINGVSARKFKLRNCDDWGGHWGAQALAFYNDENNMCVCTSFEDDSPIAILPAFNLNTKSILFASAADAATSSYNGAKPNSEMKANTFTLRYPSSGSEAAYISRDGKSVDLENASGKYLMVQNADGVYALKINSDAETVNASDISITGTALDNFNNCKVWLESTDADRITTAKIAKINNPHAVIVNSGDGDGKYLADKTVTITADKAPSGKEFDKWEIVSGGVTLASSTSASTTFTMPDNDVEVTATYKDVAKVETPHTVIVNSGDGDGKYVAGKKVTITADKAPSGKKFDKWKIVSGGVTLASSTSASTTFTMPDNDVEVTAIYKDVTVKTPANSSHPNTGDASMLVLYMILGGTSISLLLVLIALRRRKVI